MTFSLTDGDRVPRILVLVSRFDHCLLNLLYQIRVGWLRAEVVGIVSNHEDARPIAEQHRLPFHHLPVTKATKPEQEAKLLELFRDSRADLVVLARYMQVLSADLCARLAGRAINIHHSFLPSFKGARPYAQAHARGVKLIGASAHYVTADLDEGPIIEQDVARADHTQTAEQLARVGARASALGIRLTTHPGQYTVLNSEDEGIRRLAAAELEVQAELMDGMGLGPESVVILHVGGAAGGRAAAFDRFERGFALLTWPATRRSTPVRIG